MKNWPGAIVLCALVLAGCHAGGTAALPPVPSQAGPGALAPRASSAIVTLLVPPGVNASGIEGTVYSVWPNGGQLVRFTADVRSTSHLCKIVTGVRTCTIPVAIAAGGPYALISTLFNRPPVNGSFPGAKTLGGGIRTVTVAATGSTKIGLTTSSRIARATISLRPSAIHAIDAAKIAAIVTGYDANGYAIVSNGFTTAKGAVKLSIAADSASRAVLALSPTTVALPQNGALSISYASSKASASQITAGFSATVTAAANQSGVTAGSARLTALAPRIASVALPQPTSFPYTMIAGPDGTMWFSEFNAGQVGHVTTALHLIKEYPGFHHPQTIAIGSDRALWIANDDGDSSIVRLATTGALTVHALPVNTYPAGISAGPGGLLWFGSVNDNYIGTISTAGTLGTTHPLAAGNNYPSFSVEAPDGNEYFTLPGSGKLALVTPAGAISTHTVPGTSSPENVIVGPDRNVWFTDSKQGAFFRYVTSTHAFTKFPVAAADAPAGPLCIGPDGKIWFSAGIAGIGRIDPATGAVAIVKLPSSIAYPYGIALGPDGALYLTLDSPAAIARVQ